MARKDPYAILGVGRGAPLSEVKRSYRKLAFSLHPDVGDNPDETRFREAHEAYQALMRSSSGAQSRSCVRRTALATGTWSLVTVPSRFAGDSPST
jgi:preprotein translocase subunit Sec63